MGEFRYLAGRFLRLMQPKYFVSLQRIQKYQAIHQGQRCFIIGNGPSLKEMDLSPLRHEVTFGMNRIYLLFEQLGFQTTYYAAVNRLVIEQSAAEIVSQVRCPKFIDWDARDLVEFTPDMMFLRTYHDEPHFFTDIRRGIWQGSTVTFVAMQIAYYMGFETVVLIGVDHNFVTSGKPHQTVVSAGDDLNHFSPDYFGKGFRWQLPDLEGSELAYRMAKFQYEQKGREILDATAGGNLQIFKKVEYRSLFG
jgi:hypothetical protein